ncbi:MAG: hypothetical protein BGO12_15285 [Verrucomicrobia bacterium 61-8]|nr:MAG: hypothetical protein BGO12_15285 [Verrucomicrobia bacterium 61-8]
MESSIFYAPELKDTPGGERCSLDFYHPTEARDFPIIVYFHGGGLTGGNRSIPKELTQKGWGVVAASYRLSPIVQHPAYIEDAAAAIAWTIKNAKSYGGDPSKVFVLGISAGAYLAAMAILDKSYLARHEIDADQVAGLILVSGQVITHQTVRKEQGIEPSNFRPTIDRFAPLYHIRKDTPPTLCATGDWETDTLMRAEENLYFVSMMKLVGHTDIRQTVLKGANHTRACKESWPEVIKFINEKLQQPQPASPAGA